MPSSPRFRARTASGRTPRRAKAAGATDEEIREAVAIAATERYWSTMLNGLQVDLATFKAEFGALLAVEAHAE